MSKEILKEAALSLVNDLNDSSVFDRVGGDYATFEEEDYKCYLKLLMLAEFNGSPGGSFAVYLGFCEKFGIGMGEDLLEAIKDKIHYLENMKSATRLIIKG